MGKIVDKIHKLRKLFYRYPNEIGVNPHSLSDLWFTPAADSRREEIVFQSVPDKFYFLLFGAIRAQLNDYKPCRAKVIAVRSINGAVGTGFSANIKRSALVSWLFSNLWIRAYGTLIDGVAYRSTGWDQPLADMLDWVKSKKLWNSLRQQGECLSLVIDGIEVSDLLVDSYLRFKPSPEFDVNDSFVRHLVWQALRDVRRAHSYFGKARPRCYLTSYTTYLEHGIPARVALHHGIPVWTFGNINYFGQRISCSHSFHTQDYSGYRSDFELLDRKAERLDEAKKKLENRLSGGIDDATSYMRKSAYAKNTQVDLSLDIDGAVVIFLHDFYDSPHVYPDLLFMDFWRWICFTIDVLSKNNIKYFVKAHPNQIALSDVALERLRIKYPDLQWVPEGISNVQLSNGGIACGVTVYGTVAHELAYLGVPSICCARHPHHSFDFCRTARSREEYESMLMSYDELPIDRQEMKRQALVFYYMQNLYSEGDEGLLRQLYVKFWRSCNVGDLSEEDIIKNFKNLVCLPEFRRFVSAMVLDEGCEVAEE